MLNRFLDVFSSLNSQGVKYVVISGIAAMAYGVPRVAEARDHDLPRPASQTSTAGLLFEQAWQRRVAMSYKDQTFFVVSRADLIASKRAAGRKVDLEDVRLFEGGT